MRRLYTPARKSEDLPASKWTTPCADGRFLSESLFSFALRVSQGRECEYCIRSFIRSAWKRRDGLTR